MAVYMAIMLTNKTCLKARFPTIRCQLREKTISVHPFQSTQDLYTIPHPGPSSFAIDSSGMYFLGSYYYTTRSE
jgi:hypothetical protein